MENGVIKDALTARKAELERKLRARDGKAGFIENVEAIKAMVEAIEAELAKP